MATDGDASDLHLPAGDLYGAVVGQPRAVAQLRAAAIAPLPAYLFVGPAGAGQHAAALAFAADVLSRDVADPDLRDRHRRLALAGRHPDVHEFARTGPFITAEQARAVVVQASRTPVEVDTQFILLHDFHLVSSAAPILLKTIEEPSAATRFVVLAHEVSPELVTIASRCVRIDFGPVPADDLVAHLVAGGADPDLARVVAAGAGGNLDRAMLLIGDEGFAARYRAWWALADRLDGSGAAVAAATDEVLDLVDEAGVSVAGRHAEERAALDDVIDQFGSQPGEPRRTDERHKREARRLRTEELRIGLAIMGARLRDGLAGGATEPPAHAVSRFLTAIDETTEAVARYNANERLQLEALLMEFPRFR